MKLNKYIVDIQIHLITTHSNVLNWFNESVNIKNYRPLDNGWTISEILEHIALRSHYLLILIDKGSDKAARNVKGLVLNEQLDSFKYDLSIVEQIGVHKSFVWIRPEHMEPNGTKSDQEIKEELITQLNRCLNQLDKLKNGEGLLYETTMTVNDIGKMNVYEYIYFLSKHAERHITQMEENKKEYECL